MQLEHLNYLYGYDADTFQVLGGITTTGYVCVHVHTVSFCNLLSFNLVTSPPELIQHEEFS